MEKFNSHTLRLFLTALFAIFLVGFTSAQRTISGTITDAENGDPLIGANVIVTGTSTGTITDLDGKYSLAVPDDATSLTITYTGFTDQVIAITGDVLDVALSAGQLLDEVVVVGYGSVKRSDITGSVASVGEDDFNQGLVSAPDQLIQGKAAGVQVLNNSGQPGGSTTVRIRGNSSIRSGNDPLFVVDGVPLSGGSTKPGLGSALGNSPGSNPLNWLNPNDIESVQILKDASAAAIYGSRAANGVVLITTKSGRSGDPKIEFNTSIGTSSILKRYDVLNADEYRSALSQYGLTTGDYGDDVNAMDEILRNGLVQNYNVSVSGGSDNGRYRISLGYFDQEGIVKSNSLNRLNANINGKYKFLESKRLGLDFNLVATNTNEQGPPVSTNAGFRGSLIGNALQWNPTHKIYESDGSPVIIPEFGNFTNPVALLDFYDDQTNTVDILASISPSYKITNDLTYKFLYSVNSANGVRRNSVDARINLQGVEGLGNAAIGQVRSLNQILTHTLNYNTNLTSALSLDAVVGYEYQTSDVKGFNIFGQNFIGNIDYTNALQTAEQGTRNISSFANPISELQSYFARGVFNMSDKYILTATVRADGSSKFGENNKYGVFPAFAAAWNIHNEGFLEGGMFNSLRLRAGWGQTGNSSFPAGAAQERYGLTGPGAANLVNVANPDLRWETNTTTNIGLDFAILDYKLTGTIEYFNKVSSDLLFQLPTIQPAPSAFYWVNLDGEVVNSGVELALNGQILNTPNLTWDLGANATFLNNDFRNYEGPNIVYGQVFGQGSSGATIHRLDNGVALNSFYTRQHEEVGGDGQSVYTDNEALAYVGDPNPDLILGISTSVQANKLSAAFNFNGAFGHQIYNNTKMSVIPIGNLGSRNIDASLIGGANQEATSNPIKASSRYIENGDYLKLANATIGYDLGGIGNAISNARVFVSGTNLLVFTNYSGFDPEVNTVNNLNGLPSAGIEYIPYPSARTFLLGVNFGF